MMDPQLVEPFSEKLGVVALFEVWYVTVGWALRLQKAIPIPVGFLSPFDLLVSM